MGTRRVEAFLQCDHLDLSAEDWCLMQVICHKWNDHQARSLEIGALYLIDNLPCRTNKRPGNALVSQLARLQEVGLISVQDNGARYLDKRWLRIDIVDELWWQLFEGHKGKEKERDLQQSRTADVRPAATHSSRANLHATNASRKSTHSSRANLHASDASTRGYKEVERSKDLKEVEKAAVPRGDISTNGDYSGIEETPTPRPAMVPAAAMTEPATVEAVYNTMEIEMGQVVVQYPHRRWYEKFRLNKAADLDYEVFTRLGDIIHGPLTPEDVRAEARDIFGRLRQKAREGVDVAAVN